MSIPNPIPLGKDPARYFNENYDEIGADPYKYSYYQFDQFVKIYEDKTLKNFDDYMKGFLRK